LFFLKTSFWGKELATDVRQNKIEYYFAAPVDNSTDGPSNHQNFELRRIPSEQLRGQEWEEDRSVILVPGELVNADVMGFIPVSFPRSLQNQSPFNCVAHTTITNWLGLVDPSQSICSRLFGLRRIPSERPMGGGAHDGWEENRSRGPSAWCLVIGAW
jgi:hypothetical protein